MADFGLPHSWLGVILLITGLYSLGADLGWFGGAVTFWSVLWILLGLGYLGKHATGGAK